ncbi:MAG: hypothetical protein ACRDAS_06690 [Cetobacterium sp.]
MIYNRPIERVKTFTFLGVWFEDKMTWRVHIDKIVKKCNKVINTIRCLVGTEWGANRDTLMMIYRGIIRSNIDYGCMAYGSAAVSILKKLEVVQAKALRICGGAMRTTPLNALLIEMEETTLEMRRNKLSFYYWTKLQSSNFINPARNLLEEHWEFQGNNRSKRKNMMHFIGMRAQGMGVKDLKIGPAVYWPPVPPWLLSEPRVDLDILVQIKGAKGDPVIMVNNHLKKQVDRVHADIYRWVS